MTVRGILALAISLVIPFNAVAQKKQEIKEQKPGWNLFSKEQDVQLGREASAEIEKQVVVINNPEVTQYLNLLGGKLAKSKRANDFPYFFKLVADDSINAFALPGGPMYVHTGLIKAAENEGQLVGVLAHEMSHVALRHGTNQASKQNLLQLPAALAGAMAGNSMWGQLAQLGIGLGANSVLLKFSRSAETQADYNGALMMSDAGYNPIEMARFFEKLEAQSGKQGKVAGWFSSHPSPGNRVKSTEELVRLLPKQNYAGDSGQFQRMKEIANGIQVPKQPQQQSGGAPAAGGTLASSPAQIRPSGSLKEAKGPNYSFKYPENWEVMGDPNAKSLAIAPRGGIAQTQQGTQFAYAIVQSYAPPPEGGNRPNLKSETETMVNELRKQDQNLKVNGQKQVRVDGQEGILTMMQTKSAFPNEQEINALLTVQRPDGLFYMVLVAPGSEWQHVQGTYEQVFQSVKFAR